MPTLAGILIVIGIILIVSVFALPLGVLLVIVGFLIGICSPKDDSGCDDDWVNRGT